MVIRTLSLEQRTQLLQDAKEFANYITIKYPQVNEKGELNYYISGSLLVMLLSQINEFEVLDPSKIPEISIIQKKEIKPELSDKLKSFARKIGDLDYVETSAYKQLKSEIPDEYFDNEGYIKEKNKFLPLNGESLSLQELPTSLRENLFESEKNKKILCDSAKEYDKMEVVRINLGNKNYFITEPKNLMGYKFLSLLQKFPRKVQELKKDFKILHSVLSEIYSEQELVENTYEIFRSFEKIKANTEDNIRNYVKKVNRTLIFDNSVESKEIKSFLNKLKKCDSLKDRIF